MARPKGSKNKQTQLTTEEKIALVTQKIDRLQAAIKEKKEEIRLLKNEQKEEIYEKIMKAVEESGKTPEEIIALIRS